MLVLRVIRYVQYCIGSISSILHQLLQHPKRFVMRDLRPATCHVPRLSRGSFLVRPSEGIAKRERCYGIRRGVLPLRSGFRGFGVRHFSLESWKSWVEDPEGKVAKLLTVYYYYYCGTVIRLYGGGYSSVANEKRM